jgi:hypothetical protein
MSFLRVKLGVWLLGPLLREEIRLVQRGMNANPDRNMYWKGRLTATLRIYQALSTREDLLEGGR